MSIWAFEGCDGQAGVLRVYLGRMRVVGVNKLMVVDSLFLWAAVRKRGF